MGPGKKKSPPVTTGGLLLRFATTERLSRVEAFETFRFLGEIAAAALEGFEELLPQGVGGIRRDRRVSILRRLQGLQEEKGGCAFEIHRRETFPRDDRHGCLDDLFPMLVLTNRLEELVESLDDGRIDRRHRRMLVPGGFERVFRDHRSRSARDDARVVVDDDRRRLDFAILDVFEDVEDGRSGVWRDPDGRWAVVCRWWWRARIRFDPTRFDFRRFIRRRRVAQSPL